MEVEVREEANFAGPSKSNPPNALLVNNTPANPAAEGPVVIVHVEEVLLVVLVLMIWVAAIALFFNRWGKIRMLEPYQPKFHQQPHRSSCPLAPLSPPPQQQRMSFSKYNVNALTDPLSVLPSPIIRRPRQNSVFVGSTMTNLLPPRRVKSAIDLLEIFPREPSPTNYRKGSVIPILNRERRASTAVDRIPLRLRVPPTQPPTVGARYRRSSCIAERLPRSHRNFISFDSGDRRIDPPCTISFETHLEEPSCSSAMSPPPRHPPPMSRSFEQPPKRDKDLADPRQATSLDAASSSSPIAGTSRTSFERRWSLLQEEGACALPPVSIYLDDMSDVTLTAPLLEKLKSSDV